MAREKKGSWVVMGGKSGEVGYCTRCGDGLKLNMPQHIEVFAAAAKAFVRIHSTCAPGKYVEKPALTPEQWAIGRDTGISSMTIYQAITGNHTAYNDLDIPYDPDDFGRCYRLLKLFPAWRPLLGKVIDIYPKWGPFVEAWDELTAMYEAAGWHDESRKAKSDGGKMYERMKELEAISDHL